MWITNCLPVSDPIGETQIRIAGPDEYSRVVATYAAMGYGGKVRRKIDPADIVWLAERAGENVGIVRIAAEHGTLVLRGMRIAEHAQRQRLGTRMLDGIARWLGDRECYCVAYAHLTGFYAHIGFAEIEPADAPPFLAQRLVDYRDEGLNAILMRRPGRETIRERIEA
jgi:GNAT superfamily N-acetyltransferase